jgi:hypothetical protein
MSESSDPVLGLNDSRWPLTPEATPEATRLHVLPLFSLVFAFSRQPGICIQLATAHPKNKMFFLPFAVAIQ